MNWAIILIFVILIAIVLLLLKFRHIKNRVFVILIIILLIFVYFSSSRILANQNIDLKTIGGIEAAVKIYFSWLFSVGKNVKVLTGEAIKEGKTMEWGIKNITSTG